MGFPAFGELAGAAAGATGLQGAGLDVLLVVLLREPQPLGATSLLLGRIGYGSGEQQALSVGVLGVEGDVRSLAGL